MGAPSRWTCPSEDALYRFSTGDASRWRRARLQRHLDRCEACAARLDGWEAATAAYREYVTGATQGRARASAGDAGRADLSVGVSVSSRRAGEVEGDADGVERARLARFETRLRREPTPAPTSGAVLAWPRQVPRPPLGWRSMAAAIVLVAGGVFGFLPLQETITADALVARAVANDRQCPCPRADMVTIAASPHADTPANPLAEASSPMRSQPTPRGVADADAHGRGHASMGVSTASTTKVPSPRHLMSERNAHARELAERLAEYAFDWQAPLSARPYQQWRSAITARTESYHWIASDRVRVSTHAASGRIERAELILRTTDYRPVGQTWQFADGFAVELRLSERTAPAAPSPTAPSLNHLAAAGGATATPAPRTLEETEVALRVSLERAGVVLTRRLTLRNSGERLTIAGRAARRDVSRIAASAEAIGGIGVDVRAEARRTVADPRGAGDSSRGGSSTGFDAWLERTFGGSRSRAEFLPVARQLSDDYADAVAALDGLAQRLPVGASGSRLSARSRDDVRWLNAAYYARITASYERLEAHLAPLTGSVSRRVLTAAPPSPSHWRSSSAAIAPALRALSAELAGLASPISPSSSAPSDGTTADDVERTAGASLRKKLVAVVPR